MSLIPKAPVAYDQLMFLSVESLEYYNQHGQIHEVIQ